MNYPVGQHYDHFIRHQVKIGRFGSPEDVIVEGLRLVEQRERKIKALREEVQAVLADERRYSFDEVMKYSI